MGVRARLRGLALACGVGVAVAAAAAPAQAGTVRVEGRSGFPGNNYLAVTYDAFAGERNDVTVDYDPATGVLWLKDRNNHVLPALDDGGLTLQRCSLRPNGARCVAGASRFGEVSMWLKDGDDASLVHAAADVFLTGGPGADRLTAETGPLGGFVRLFGDEGADTLVASGSSIDTLGGGSGDDVLRGGAGETALFGGPGADDLSGRAGNDSLHYDPRTLSFYDASWAYVTTGVFVTFNGSADDGQPGEGDNVGEDVERILATDFDDEIIGNGGGQSIFGRMGDDLLDGAGGDDHLAGNSGNDTVVGGAGRDTVDGANVASGVVEPEPDDDLLRLRDGEPDIYHCGLGADVVEADSLDVFGPFGDPAGCEDVQVA